MRELTLQEVARIGRMFINGDVVEELLLDKYGHTDYDFEKFNQTKAVLMKIERICPELEASAILWTPRAGAPDKAEPAVCASVLPEEGWAVTRMNDAQARAFRGEENTALKRERSISSYYPVYNSDHEIVAVLELLRVNAEPNDI